MTLYITVIWQPNQNASHVLNSGRRECPEVGDVHGDLYLEVDTSGVKYG